MAKQYLILKPFVVWFVPAEGGHAKRKEYKPGFIVDEADVPADQSGEVWCSPEHGLAKEITPDGAQTA